MPMRFDKQTRNTTWFRRKAALSFLDIGLAKIGIRDVARKAGVAVGTVSRVINDHPSVTPDVRKRVKQVILALKYKPDVFAQSMRRKASRTLGIIIPDLKNPFFAELMQHAEVAARQRGFNVFFLSSMEDPEAEADHILSLASRKVDGILLVPGYKPHRIEPLRGLPLIIVDRLVEGMPGIGADNRGGARIGVEYLIGLGHRRISCLAGPQSFLIAGQRLNGYFDAMRRPSIGGSDLLQETVVHAPYDAENGRLAAARLLSAPKSERPTAIFANSDLLAIGALRAAADLGIAVPRDLSIVGFDGIPMAELTTPRLTTVAQPIAQFAGAAIEILLGGRQPPPAGQPLMFDCTLVERESSGPPRL